MPQIELLKLVGLDVITDGEFRRAAWNPATSFAPDAPIAGYSPVDDHRITYMKFGATIPGKSCCATLARLGRDIVRSEYGFLSQHAGHRTKYTCTAPSYHRHFWHPVHSRDAYTTVDDYLVGVRDFMRRHIVEPTTSSSTRCSRAFPTSTCCCSNTTRSAPAG